MKASRTPGPLRPWRRLVELTLAWLVIFAGSPGVLTGNGSALLAVVGVAWWGAVVCRPFGRKRRLERLAEWGGNAFGGGLLMWWVWYVVPFGVFYIGAGWGLYFLLGGAFVRARGRLPLGVAVALGWLGCETLRTVLAPPLGLGWQQLGHQVHHHLWLSGSARVWGLEGLTLVLAALGGLLAELQVTRRVSRPTLVFAGATLLLGVGLALATSPPATQDGPRVLLVQPGFPQERKQFDDPDRNFAAVFELTKRGLEENRAAGGAEIDLVCWGETMLYTPLFDVEVEAALDRGLRLPAWQGQLDRRLVSRWRAKERERVQERILANGGAGILAPGTSFAVGAELYAPRDDGIARFNAIVLYDPQGRRSEPAAKRFLVPGAETMMGLERFEVVRNVVLSMAGYVPDFLAASETAILPLGTRDGRSFAVATTVCFDNAFLAAYTEPVAAEPVDFHLVASNEAWYRESCEMDQMLAFSRVIALATGRSIVRATNSGVSTVLGPDGRELGRVTEGGAPEGEDRSIAGTLAVTVPVPVDRSAGGPPYARFRGLVRGLVGLGVALSWLLLRRRSNPDEEGG